MNRRTALTGVAAVAAWTLLGGATSQRRWDRGSEGDLLLYTDGQDPGSGEVGEVLAKQLRRILPDSGARVRSEGSAARVASVMSARNDGVAVLAYGIALEMYRGDPGSKAGGPVDLRVLVENYKYRVVCRADFGFDQAYLVAEALMGQPEPLKLTIPDRPPGTTSRDMIPTHPGAMAFLKSEPLENRPESR